MTANPPSPDIEAQPPPPPDPPRDLATSTPAATSDSQEKPATSTPPTSTPPTSIPLTSIPLTSIPLTSTPLTSTPLTSTPPTTANPPENQLASAPTSTERPYSSFTVSQKRAIVVAASAAAFISPLTGSIYFPALTTISQDLGVSASKINLTVTLYLIWQGAAPMLIAGFSDNVGRRPAYFLCFAIYAVANLALSLQNSYPALLTLRMLQSAGSSGTVALAQGMVADIVTPAERGSYIGYASAPAMLGPSLSPIIGGLIAQNLNWHWIFWFLLILSLGFGIPFLLFLPETGRKVVGDGSVKPPWPNMNLTDYYRHRARERRGEFPDDKLVQELRKNYKFSPPNPIPTFLIMFDLETAILLLVTGLLLSCFYAISTGASYSFATVYGFNDLQVGLMFLPIGAGGIISAFTTGRIVDGNFRRWCRKCGIQADKRVRQDLSNFPVERARLEVFLPMLYLGMLATIGYGWMLSYKVSLAGPVIVMFAMGWALIAASQALSALMVDIWPGKAAAATAANNMFRCGLGAAATAAIEPMSAAMGRGWAYTLLALLAVACSPLVWLMMAKGIQWRKRRAEKETQKAERKAERRRAKDEAKEASAK